MINYEDIMVFLQDFEKFREEKQEKHLKRILSDDGLKEWLFKPSSGVENNAVRVAKLYDQLSKYRVMKVLYDVIDDGGRDKFDRTTATILHSICNLSITANNAKVDEITSLKRDGKIFEKEETRLMDKLVKHNKVILDIDKLARKLVRKKAKRLEDDVNLPRDLISLALYSMPEPEYIDRVKVSFYLDGYLTALYALLESNDYDTDMSKVDWKEFFKVLFGKENIIEAASFIILEGVHRIKGYKSKIVTECWDSLTNFALKELEKSPDSTRDQMLELYIKRIDKMFANKSYDLRVNLLSLDKYVFPNLSKAVSKYANTLKDIISKSSENENDE